MVRVPVPEEYEDDFIGVTVSRERASLVVGGYDRRADIEVDDPDLDRDIRVREDDDGRYVGVHEDLAEEVADYLGVRVPEAAESAESDSEDDEGDSSNDAMDAESEPAIAESLDAGRCPWCPEDDRYEGDAVGQHASAAHPDEWTAYKNDEE